MRQPVKPIPCSCATCPTNGTPTSAPWSQQPMRQRRPLQRTPSRRRTRCEPSCSPCRSPLLLGLKGLAPRYVLLLGVQVGGYQEAAACGCTAASGSAGTAAAAAAGCRCSQHGRQPRHLARPWTHTGRHGPKKVTACNGGGQHSWQGKAGCTCWAACESKGRAVLATTQCMISQPTSA